MGRRSIEEIRKEEIITAFFKVVSKKGLAGASIREIASTANCNHGIIRYYFGNKEGLIISALEFLGDNCITTLQNGVSKFDTATDKMKYVFKGYRYNKLDIDVHAPWYEIFVYSRTTPLVSKTLVKIYKGMVNSIRDIIVMGIASGEFRNVDLDVITNMILWYLEGALFFSVNSIYIVPHESMDKQFTEVILSYLVKDE